MKNAEIENTNSEYVDSLNSSNEKKESNFSNESNYTKFDSDNNKSLYKYENSNVEFFQNLSTLQFLSAHNFLAIDIDTDKIRFITGKSSSGNIQVKKWGVQVAPIGEKDRFKSIKLTLDNIKANYYKAGFKIHVCFFSPDITVRQFVLPKLRKASELYNAVYYKLQTDLPGFSEKSEWRYKIIDEFQDNNVKYLRVVVVVVPSDLIKKLIGMLESSGLTPDTLVPRSVASFHSFKKMISDSDSDILVDISYDMTHINFIANSNLEYARNLASGAANLEVAVHDKKGKILGPDDISIKEEDGIGKNGALRPELIRKSLQSRLKLLQAQQNPVLQLFKNELENSIEYFNGLNKNKKVNRVFLTGYGIQKESLLSFLKNNISQPVFVLSPKLEDEKNTLNFGQYFATIGTIIDPKDTFNLIPKEYLRKQLYKNLNYLVSIVLVIALISLIYLNNSIDNTTEAVQNELVSVSKQYEELNPIETEFQRHEKEIQSLKSEEARLLKLIKNNSPLINVLKFLSNETPEQIVLSDFSLSSQRAALTGRRGMQNQVRSDNADSQYVVSFSGNVVGDYLMSDITLINYVDHLKNLNFFRTIEISQKDKKSDRQSLRFEIRATL
ncbi:MAG: hypothetical protein KDF60_13895 [Calditrichaeota bacterium]|nr:hypothetical protein [Calditrichota bacterium]